MSALGPIENFFGLPKTDSMGELDREGRNSWWDLEYLEAETVGL